MLGLKAITPDLHQRLPGKDNQPVHGFAAPPSGSATAVWISFVIGPGWTDTWTRLGEWLISQQGVGNVQRVDVSPFHQLGRFKWEQLGMEYKLRDAEPPSREKVEESLPGFVRRG